jgi:hypothetical protein
MTDGLTVAAVLLVLGPVVPGVALSNPALFRVWFAPRDEHLALVGAHRRGWAAINAGFTIATVLTTAGLALLAGNVHAADGQRAVLTSAVVAYAIAGSLWCVVLAIRTRTTPTLADLVAAGTPTEPAETLLGAALGGLFAAFILATSAALAVLGATLTGSGLIAAPVGWLTTLIPAVVIASFLRSGDAVPAVLYLPTLLVGVAFLLGWT